jgi:lipoprotein NlpI
MSILNFHSERANVLHGTTSAAFVAAGLFIVAPAGAQTQQESSWCSGAAPDLQIEGCTALIQSGQLPGKYLAFAYNNRGIAYDEKKDFDRAIADFTEAIRLDPKYAAAYDNRGNAYNAKGDFDRAIPDYTEAIRLDPKNAFAYRHRGLAYFYNGNFAKALADLGQASGLDPKDAYTALWADIVGQRDNVKSRLSQAISQIDMTAWPAPVIRMFLGQMTPAAVLAAADDPDATKKTGQVCEANFYSGELALRQGAKEGAGRLFRLAASDCPKDFDEWGAANKELKALGAAP